MADEPKVTVFPQVSFPSTKRSEGGNLVVQVRTNAKEVAEVAAALRTRVGSAILSDADQRAAFIQQKLRAAVLGAYTKAATGRMSRGIFATATKVGSPEGGVQTVIRVTMFNYREANFITNLGGRGYFSRFPVGPYRIFAQGVEGTLSLLAPMRKRNSIRSSRKTLSIVKEHGVGRLKVPRRSAFFSASRAPGRGGGESRNIGDILGPREGEPLGAFFFYPLWVNHPGFPEDVITQVALEEGARFTQEVPGEVAAVSANIPVVKPSVQFRGGGFVYKAPVSSQLVINKQQTSRRIR
jgi:hypothetical protein